MAHIKFKQDEVKKLVEFTESSKQFKGAYGAEDEPALLLVGDQGVYLMSNAVPNLMADGTVAKSPDQKGKRYVVYAEGINPEVDEFDDWWELKRATFGGDDGAEQLPLSSFQTILPQLKPGQPLVLEITPKSIGFVV